MVPSSRATIILDTNMSPEALDGLEEFSHVWLTFQFHLNTNTLKEAKAFKGVINKDNETDEKNRKHSKRAYTFTAKITPPMLKEKKGVLATRSPHRPNPIGLTLARIYKVDKRNRTLELRACDLVQDTPILDIKPYCPEYDTIPTHQCIIPKWIEETVQTRNIVTWLSDAQEQVNLLQNDLMQFKNDSQGFIECMTETLQAEVRSKFQTNKYINDARLGIACEVPFDECIVSYLWNSNTSMEVIKVILNETTERYKRIEKRNKRDVKREAFRRDAILKSLNSKLDILEMKSDEKECIYCKKIAYPTANDGYINGYCIKCYETQRYREGLE